ncbi:class I SAM-dependent methyltransferase [Nocardioides humilatus]|uniref:Class I SAM-dependent methyltransferase n=1 Tax=Nocardioides humilatus TaxID=2607660 RepID=A0A5B1LHP6_9ACTN|nr:cyclopropane-fatty-acyl-phospholipid synthase family protein [Nocardioides humilatus]KAA1420245.1 class I SAM-dependent methyltransferase [Nocardioides humilatus]
MTAVATRLADALEPFVGGDLPVRLVAWDGSTAGPDDAPTVELRSPDALKRLLWQPGELGAAQAYVTGELEVPGDLDAALTHAFSVAQERNLSGSRARVGAVLGAVRTAVGLGVLGRRPAPPPTQAKVRGRLHTRERDRSAISHHYDLSTDFYSLILDPTMAYSCGYHADASVSLEEAQQAKFALVGRKLGLAPGMRVLDVGCGWGSLSIALAEQFGVHVVGVTISKEQRRFAEAAARRHEVDHLVEFRLCDYRDATPLPGAEYDAVVSLEMGEHVGEGNYPTYAGVLRDSVRPGGRVLVQQMSRSGPWPGGGPFIESFIAPDMHMRPVGATIQLLEAAGLELRDVHALREHYVLTVAGWIERFEANRDQIEALVGEEMVRVWQLYLVGGSMAFRDGRMGVDQLLLVRPGADHTLPAERDW